MNNNVYQMFGAWISPDGDILWTNNANNHRLVIEQFKLREELEAKAEKLTYTEKEQIEHKNYDLPYIALKCGYVRITSCKNQIGVEMFKNIKRSSYQISAIVKTVTNFFQNDAIICLEIISETDTSSEFFNLLLKFHQYLNNNNS